MKNNNVIYDKGISISFKMRDEIVHYSIEGYNINKNDLIEMENSIISQRNGAKIYSIIDAGDYSKLSTELKQYLISEERSWVIKAEAIVTKGFARKILADLYFQLNLPLVPTKTFSNLSDAENWLRSLDRTKNSAA